jgi:hypothetical protein
MRKPIFLDDSTGFADGVLWRNVHWGKNEAWYFSGQGNVNWEAEAMDYILKEQGMEFGWCFGSTLMIPKVEGQVDLVETIWFGQRGSKKLTTGTHEAVDAVPVGVVSEQWCQSGRWTEFRAKLEW